jgi:hypothetical protein
MNILKEVELCRSRNTYELKEAADGRVLRVGFNRPGDRRPYTGLVSVTLEDGFYSPVQKLRIYFAVVFIQSVPIQSVPILK